MNLRPAIVLFGDSLTQFGYGEGAVKVGWASLLSSAYQRRADVLNRGFSGYNTKFALDLVPKIFGHTGTEAKTGTGTGTTATHFLFVTVFLGANDAAIPGERQHVPLKDYGKNLRKIIEGIRQKTKDSPPFPIIVMTPPPIDDEAWKAYLGLFDYFDRQNSVAREYGLEAQRVAKELDCSVLDTWKLLGGDQPGYGKHLSDGLHLSESGNQLIYEGLLQHIKTEYPSLGPQEIVEGKGYHGNGIPPDEKLWDELC